MNKLLTESIQRWTHLALSIEDSDLEKNWVWKEYDEGIRFAFFRVSEELRTLAARLRSARTNQGLVLSEAQLILGNYHNAYRDLQAALLGVSTEDIDRAPTEKEWSIRQIYAHMLGAEFGFRSAIRYALEGHRAGTWLSAPIPEEAYPRLYGISEADYKFLHEGPYAAMAVYHADLHRAIQHEFSKITADELDQPAVFWEEIRFPIRFRLHRFESHLRQHTIQVDKTLMLLNLPPSEIKRLLRMIYAAWADAENAFLGTPVAFSEAIIAQHIDIIQDVTDQIARVLKA